MKRTRKWAVLGRLVAIEWSRQPQGSKLAFETDLASKLGLSRASLRNYADAVRLVRNVPDLGLRAILFRSSAVAAAVASRWFQRDPETLRDYFNSGLRDEPQRIVDDRALLTAEREARRASPRLAPHRLVAPANIAAQLQWVIERRHAGFRDELRRLVPGLPDWGRRGNVALIATKDPLSRFLGITEVLVVSNRLDGNPETEWNPGLARNFLSVAFIAIPERVVLERYRSEARAIWTRALAASCYVELAVLVLNDSAARRHLLSQVPLEGADWLRHPAQFQAGQSDPFNRRGRSQPILARLPRHRSAILISTRRSLSNDLFG